MKKLEIALFGATSHIAKGLIYNFLQRRGFILHLYTRSLDKTLSFLDAIGASAGKVCVVHHGYENFMQCSYDVVINCVGVGTMNKLQGNYVNYFIVGEEYDNLAISYLCNICPNALYISFSSGAVYGRGYSSPAEENTINSIRVNHVAAEDYFAITKLNSEAKHRAFNGLKIVDLRIFSYFSRFIDLTDGYFITEIMDCILNKKVLITDSVDMVRDYLHPEDLFSIVLQCMDAGEINAVFDVISDKPVKKSKLLDYFSSRYGLEYVVGGSMDQVSATGVKKIYCSQYNNASAIGYKAKYTSMDTIKLEAEHILSGADQSK